MMLSVTDWLRPSLLHTTNDDKDMRIAVQQVAKHAKDEILPQSKDFQIWGNAIEKILDSVQESEVCVRIVNSEESMNLNSHYRQQAKPTNVLAFPCADQVPDEMPYLGDVVLDLDTILVEANREQKEGLNHWAHLFVHGVLHLHGYRHDEEDEAEQMRAQEISILHYLGFANPYQGLYDD